jgi:hypothetical protein
VEGNFVVVGTRKAIGRLGKIAFKTTTCGKVDISLPCGVEGVSHGEACAWFENVRNFAMGSACDGKELAPFDNDKVLLQCQEKEGDLK